MKELFLLLIVGVLPLISHAQAVGGNGIPGGPTSGVTSINGVSGPFIFSGGGVSCTSTTCVFSSTNAVSSVFGRTGAVVAVGGDYAAAQVTNAAATNAANTFTLPQTAPGFFPQSTSAGPYSVYFNDLYTFSDLNATVIGSPSGDICAIVSSTIANHPALVELESGTVASAGYACGLNSDSNYFLASGTVPWTYETEVEPIALPGTNTGSFQAGLVGTRTVSPWTTGIGFYLSDLNGTPNDWYCRYGTTQTDTTVAATAAFHRLTLSSDGTNVHWYVDGVQVCGTGVAVGSMPVANVEAEFTAVAGTSAANTAMYIDYILFEMMVTR